MLEAGIEVAFVSKTVSVVVFVSVSVLVSVSVIVSAQTKLVEDGAGENNKVAPALVGGTVHGRTGRPFGPHFGF